MRKKKILIIFCILLTLGLDGFCLAGSIWAKRDKNLPGFYADDKARNVGDIITIKILEDSTTENKLKRTLSNTNSREINFDGDIDFDYDILDKVLPDPLLPSLNHSSSSSRSMDGKADFKDERSFEDSISVTVIDVMPNNNLVVLGQRTRDIGSDIQIIEVSGIVRPSDISFNNSVSSENVADFRIVSRNKGVSTSYGKPGWFGRFLDFIWPL